MKKILDGVLQFQQNISAEEREHLESLASGQQPEAMLITCADSRIEPGRMTGTKPGELFIVRNVGNIVPVFGDTDQHVSAAVEYAVEVLNVRHIIVCGHTHCGAMDAIMNPDKLTPLPAVAAWLKKAGDLRHMDGPDALDHLIEQNVLTQIGHLRTYDSVSRLLRENSLELHGWVYDVASGRVRCWNQGERRFLPLEKSAPLVLTHAGIGASHV